MCLVKCTVKCKHLLKAVILRVEEVLMTAEEDMKRVLSYRVHVARQKNFFGSMEKKINT